MKFSLGFVLAISLAGLQFLAITTVVSTSFISSERAMLQQARDLLVKAGANASEHSDGFLDPARKAAELSSRVIESGIATESDVTAMEQFFFQVLQSQPQFSGVYFGDEQGNFVYVMRSHGQSAFRTKIVRITGDNRSTEFIWRNSDFSSVAVESDPADSFDPRTRPWYKSARETGDTIWTDPYIFFSSQQPGITVATPVAKNGSVKGVVGVDIEISTISEFLSQLQISDRGSAMILNENGAVIAHPDIEQIIVRNADTTLSFVDIHEIKDPVARSAFADLEGKGVALSSQEIQSEFNFDKDRYVSYFKPLLAMGLPWTIAVYAPETDFTKGIRDNRTRNIWLAAAISFVAALVGLSLSELILKPVRAFAVRTALVSQGEMSAAEPLPRTYHELKNANETMIDEIAQRREADAKILELNRDLSHFSRVNLMGQMATGLAHELSQPLTAISQNVDSAITTARQQDGSQDLLDILTELDEQAHRGGDILRALRGFVRKDQGTQTSFDFNELLGQTQRMLQNEADAHDITLRFETSEIPNVVANRIQIAQILINLIRNAIEAIAEAASDTRVINVSTLIEPDGLQVCVEDTGPGIDPDVTLFKQFETSKKDGMGLGLSICRTLAEANGGRLWYDTDIRQGARFCLSLRTNAAPAQHETA